MRPILLLPPGAGLSIEEVHVSGEVVHLTARCRAATAICPVCGHRSAGVHSWYGRRLADLPWCGRQVLWRIRACRFWCREQTCPRRTFSEPVPVMAPRHARRTPRLQVALEKLALRVGGRPGARLSACLKMPTSRMSLLRLLRALPDRPAITPRVLGVDEFAFRQGRRYGTLLVDVEAHRPIDLLEDPSAEALVRWLAAHPGVEVICRDRDGVYASAASRGAPRAQQVADRWHLIHSLADALERFAARALVSRAWQHHSGTSGASAQPQLAAPARSHVAGRLGPRTEQRHANVHAQLLDYSRIPPAHGAAARTPY